MSYVRIVAAYDDDDRQRMIIVGPQKIDNSLSDNVEMFGYIKDWSEDESNYVEYPFILKNISETDGVADWGAFDETRTVLDVYGRRLVEGEKIVRTENNEVYKYTIISISEIGS